jgi:hypothetical protein
MLAHCVNPDCCAPLHSFSEGRLYQFEIVSISIAASDSALNPFDEKPERQAVHYWLCGQCAESLDLRLEPLQGLRVIPLTASQEAVEKTDRQLADHVFNPSHRC